MQEDWIPAGKDLYVFSLQHCIGVQSVEQSIQKHLLRMNYPTAYRSITSLAGSALRGQVQDVCILLFAVLFSRSVPTGPMRVA